MSRIIVFAILLVPFCIYGHRPDADKPGIPGKETGREIGIMFHNVENLFDTVDDTLSDDDEFLPSSPRHWDQRKLNDKVMKLYKVIVAAGGWQPPHIIGLSEVENKYVTGLLLNKTPLSKYAYGSVHYDSPDRRGMDVALLYRKGFLEIINSNKITVDFPFEKDRKTRDILYVKMLHNGADTIHFYVNHWPSRYGGKAASEKYRMFAARALKAHTDSVMSVFPASAIVIMGDFNDEPDDRSLTEGLQAMAPPAEPDISSLYNLSARGMFKLEGTIKYMNDWYLFDQFIVSGALLQDTCRLVTSCKKVRIFAPDFLLEPDEKYLGKKPFRLYSGFRYNGGFSDHLPVCLSVSANSPGYETCRKGITEQITMKK